MFKMNEKQKALFDKLTTLQQEVSLNSLSGMSDADSYRNSCGKATTDSSMRAGASEILANPNVTAFLDEMKAEAVNDAIMSRERMMEIQSKLADIDATILSQLTLAQLTELKGGFDVKLKAMKQLSELAGYDAPKKIEVDAKEELTPWGAISIDIDD